MRARESCLRRILETGQVIRFETSAEKLKNRHENDVLEVELIDPITKEQGTLEFVATQYEILGPELTRISGNIGDYLQIFIRIRNESENADVKIDLRSPPCKI